jgi:hypothetical protein
MLLSVFDAHIWPMGRVLPRVMPLGLQGQGVAG